MRHDITKNFQVVKKGKQFYIQIIGLNGEYYDSLAKVNAYACLNPLDNYK